MHKVSTYIIGILIFTMFIYGGISMISEFASVDSSFIDANKFSKFNNTFNKYNDVVSETDNLESSITNSDSDFGVFGVLNGLINTAWNTMVTIFSSFSFMDSAFNGLTEFLGVPTWTIGLILSIITIILIFAIIGAIFQRDI